MAIPPNAVAFKLNPNFWR
jgi:hypothetical protein